jgi:hypothetical protein
VKKVFFLFFILLIASATRAQSSGGQDSTGLSSNDLRPRRETYIIETYPSPARHGQTIKIRIYNHNPQMLSLHVVDINDKIVAELQTPETLANGVHEYDFHTNLVATGSYHIRLTTYTSTGSENVTQDSRFIVLH